MKPIIILSGPVGAGKSTVARELASLFAGPVSYIEGDKFWSFVVKGCLQQNRFKHFKIIMMAMTAAAMPYAMADYDIIIDFSIPPWFLNIIRKMLRVKKIPFDYVVIRPSEAVCALRAATRNEGKITDYTQYHELYISFDEAEKFIIDDDAITPAELARVIYDGLKAGMFRVC